MGYAFEGCSFDLGTFHDIQHGMDTGDAKPVKQRMRRTTAFFGGVGSVCVCGGGGGGGGGPS